MTADLPKTDPSPAMPKRSQSILDGAEQHRRDTWLTIILPMATAVVTLLLLLAISLLLIITRRTQVAAVSDLLLVIWVLCPLVLCLLPIYLGLVALAYGVARLHSGTGGRLSKLEALSLRLTERTAKVGEMVGRRSIPLAGALSILDRVWGSQPAKRGQADEETEHDSTDTE